MPVAWTESLLRQRRRCGDPESVWAFGNATVLARRRMELGELSTRCVAQLVPREQPHRHLKQRYAEDDEEYDNRNQTVHRLNPLH